MTPRQNGAVGCWADSVPANHNCLELLKPKKMSRKKPAPLRNATFRISDVEVLTASDFAKGSEEESWGSDGWPCCG